MMNDKLSVPSTDLHLRRTIISTVLIQIDYHCSTSENNLALRYSKDVREKVMDGRASDFYLYFLELLLLSTSIPPLQPIPTLPSRSPRTTGTDEGWNDSFQRSPTFTWTRQRRR